MPGSRQCPIHVLWPNAEGSQTDGVALGPRVFSRMSPPAPRGSPETQGRRLQNKAESSGVFACTSMCAMGGRHVVQPANRPILVTICRGEPEHLSQTAADGRA